MLEAPEVGSARGIGSFGPCDATLLSNSDGRVAVDDIGGKDCNDDDVFICAIGRCAGFAGGGIRCAF